MVHSGFKDIGEYNYIIDAINEKHIAFNKKDVEKERHVAVTFETGVAAAKEVQKVAVEVEEEYFMIVI
ncbi:14376_t:CDS:2 [Funneliformis geosporum]|uniref:14376_t:CDS:1 n=1 Tax=Funneliformis geosporum TaxID=1117311 RepID=A0A9W4SE26_9GLOM|nr:14376_t:CDS:2 [Funneliformis geosporum]